MRVVCPFTDLQPATYRRLRALEPRHRVEFVYVGDEPTDYARLLRQLWADGETFVIVEHDIVPHRDTIDSFDRCRHDYCAAPYPWRTCVGVALGCTKFGGRLLQAYPHAVEIASRVPSNYGPVGHYRQLDVWLQAAVLRDLYQQQPHCHLPPVAHLNDAQRLDPLFADKPIVQSVQGRTHLPDGLVARIAAEVTGG